MRLHLYALVLAMLPVAAGGADLKLYLDDLRPTPFEKVEFGLDVGAGTFVSTLTPDAHATIGDLIAADTWDFSGIVTGTPTASTVSLITLDETCNAESCGYNPGGQFPERYLTREDRNYDDPPNLVKVNAVSEVEILPTEAAIWLRAGAQNEGVEGALGEGESRFCYFTEGGETRTPSYLWRLAHEDADGWYLQSGDAWSTDPFDCEQNVFNQVCGEPGFFDKIWIRACGDHAGTQSGEVLKEGIVTLPSGHRLNVLLARTVADFCVYTGSSCILKVDEVRTVVYLLVSPHFGTVVRLQSQQNAIDLTSWDTVNETDIKFGLFPPLSIQVDGAGADWVELSWDPGRITSHIDRYRVHWNTESGAGAPYAFDSVTQASQVAFNGTSAVVSGLSPETTYFFTITAETDYTNPSTGEMRTYESLLYPEQVASDLGDVYPVEVQATTTDDVPCAPTLEVEDLRIRRAGPELELCWSPSADPCLTDYRIHGGTSPESDAVFSPLADTGTRTCETVPGAEGYYLVNILGTGGEGPWGHYNR